MKLYLKISLILTIVLLAISCRKDSPTQETKKNTENIQKTVSFSVDQLVTTNNKTISNYDNYANNKLKLDGINGSENSVNHFENRYGTPDYDKIVQLTTVNNDFYTIVPLVKRYRSSASVDNLLVTWKYKDEFFSRIIHNDRTLTDRTFDHTPITRKFDGFFQFYSSVYDDTYRTSPSIISDLPDGCYKVVPCDCEEGWGLVEIECPSVEDEEDEEEDQSGGSSGGTSVTGGGSGLDGIFGETTDPNCLPDCVDCEYTGDNPDCTKPLETYDNCTTLGLPDWICCTKEGSPGCSELMDAKYTLHDLYGIPKNIVECINTEAISAVNYIKQGGSVKSVLDFGKIRCYLPEAKFDRFKELNKILKRKPEALVKKCMEQYELNIEDYRYLYEMDIPKETKDKLDSSPFKLQPIDDGNVAITNVDYYGVVLDQLPDVNGDGLNNEKPEEVFEAFRQKFTDLASGKKDDFNSNCRAVPTFNMSWAFEYYGYPSGLKNADEENWTDLSTDGTPLNTVFFIDGRSSNILADAVADNGAIIISEYNKNSHFIGSSINTPKSNSQPYSGNRQWGYVMNADGKMEIYTKAIDVAHLPDLMKIGKTCATKDYYKIAYLTWTNLQNKVKIWAKSYKVSATILYPKQALVPNERIEELLTQETTIKDEEIDCD